MSYPPYCTITRTLTLYCTIIPRFSLEVLSSILQPREIQKINITNTVYFLANQNRISQEHDWMLLHYKTTKATLTVLGSLVNNSVTEVSTREVQNNLACGSCSAAESACTHSTSLIKVFLLFRTTSNPVYTVHKRNARLEETVKSTQIEITDVFFRFTFSKFYTLTTWLLIAVVGTA